MSEYRPLRNPGGPRRDDAEQETGLELGGSANTFSSVANLCNTIRTCPLSTFMQLT